MRWTLVTGGAKHLGAAICIELARQGYSVVVHYRNSEKEAHAVVDHCLKYHVQAECIQGDFATLETTKDFIHRYQNKFPETENLINNVGNYFLGSSLEISEELWFELYQTNLHTPYLLIKNLHPSLKKCKGSIINIGVSGLNAARANTYSTAYTMTKSSLLALTKSLALELASDQVRVNMVSPGYLDTSIDLPKDLSEIPMHRAAKSEEVAEVVSFLLSDKAQYLTGQNIEVAGGMGL